MPGYLYIYEFNPLYPRQILNESFEINLLGSTYSRRTINEGEV